MNKVILCGRLTRPPIVSYTRGAEALCVARYTLAVDRKTKEQQAADFISCVAFGKNGEFAEKYLNQGTKILIVGRIQTGQYTNQAGQRIYTTEVIVEEQEFAESKNAAADQMTMEADQDGFMSMPEENGLPFA